MVAASSLVVGAEVGVSSIAWNGHVPCTTLILAAWLGRDRAGVEVH